MTTETTPKTYHEAPKIFKRWKAYEDSLLKSMVKNDFNSEQIAEKLGRTRSSVCCRKNFLGIKGRMKQARGSKMPLTSFSRTTHNTTPPKPKQIIIKRDYTPFPVSHSTVRTETTPKIKSFGQHIDSVIHTAKSLGLKVNITISSEK